MCKNTLFHCAIYYIYLQNIKKEANLIREKIYIIENDKQNAQNLATAIKDNLQMDVCCFDSVEEALGSAKTESPNSIRALVLSMRLSMNTYAPLAKIPTILVTNHIPIQGKHLLLYNNLVDTVVGYGGKNIAYILNLIRHISSVSHIKVLLIEDDSAVRKLVARNLAALGVGVVEATNVAAASNILERDEKIRTIFISGDNEDALTFIRKQREEYGKSDFPIIALINENTQTDEALELLHSGVLDCIKKEFATSGALEYFQMRIRTILRYVVSYFQMEDMARFDSLTNTLNRRSFYDISENIFANFKRGNISIALAIIDIDNFKSINDTYGHSAGDATIVALCGKVKEQIRQSDLVARFGGEEFCILLSGTSGEDALATLNRIRKSVEDTELKYEDKKIKFTISVGCCYEIAPTLKGMLEIADRRLYIAKKNGKNRVIGNDDIISR
jgi:diguanylate cyclase (GGDEF)-like protein